MKYILAILALGVLIIVHELGHFIMAKVNKVKVIEFTIGMGPKVFSYQGKETLYSISLLPIGGYVEMLGSHEDVDDERSFSSKSPIRRISIIIAGVFMNFVLAIRIFTAVLTYHGYADNTVGALTKDAPLEKAGVEVGSRITAINGSKIFTYVDISANTDLSTGKEVTVKYEYKGKEKEVKVTPELYEDEDGSSRYIIGFTYGVVKDPTLWQGVKQSFKQTATLINQTVKTLVNLITGNGSFKKDLGGPVTVVKLSADAAESGMWDLMNLVAILSISLAIFNLIPFPALDGGWTILLLIELITRRKVPEKFVAVINTVGMVLLLALMVAVTVKDILFPASL